MMMQWRHLEDALLAQFVAAYLQDHAHRLDHEHATDEGQQQFLLDDHRNRGDRAAERERAYVSHEYLSRMRVIPKEPDARANHRTAEDSQLGHLWNARQFKVVGKHRVTAYISQYRESAGGDDCASDREPVESVRKVHGIAGPYDDHRDECNEWQECQQPQIVIAYQRTDDQVRPEFLYERHDQMSAVFTARLHHDQDHRDNECKQELEP